MTKQDMTFINRLDTIYSRHGSSEDLTRSHNR